MMTSTNTTTTTPPHAHSPHNNNNNNNTNNTNNTNNNNIEETPPQFLHSQNSSTYLGHDLTTNHNNNNNNNTNGPHLIHRIEKTKKWLYRSMIVCILVYLLQSTSQLIFTEIFIACHSNDQTYGSGVLILYNSYIIVIGFINSLSDFTPFLMCYIFHKSNEIVKDIVKDHYMSGGAGAGFGHYDFTTMTESSYNVLTGDVLNSQQILTDDATSLRNGEETEDDELPIHHPFMQQQQQQHSMVVHALPHGTTMLYGSNDHHHAVSTTNHHQFLYYFQDQNYFLNNNNHNTTL
ncbi:hypothetical protein C9374_002705 [Naegleria lovaniensis]|uniref:Uncharacterized protein n=1 Tax=Naegleria lovaniensis TaxID=51637 RepID=A0AA88KLW7_NAELO|nr:uncharacterized protein C9374_002705 [Naegleria lovaniensis]KAG2386259.1 hypothetical protein C9374_002705 [Naegleria lovaniensis]